MTPMSKRSEFPGSAMTFLSATLFVAAVLVSGCGDGARPFGDDSGIASGTGGATTDGGDGSGGTSGSGSGGSGTGTGGAVGTGTGGSAGNGTGGVTATGSGGTAGGPGGSTGTGGAGSGGHPGTGGTAATGGATGTGGGGTTTGSGGAVGSGGVVGTGGRVGTGGVVATGGTVGSGGVVGSGGSVGTGGVTGSGGITGTGGANPKTCDQISSAYQDEMPKAKSCSTLVLRSTCASRVSRGLGCDMNCYTYVDDDTQLTALAKQWLDNKCDSLITVCPLIACQNPSGARCTTSGTLTTGMCVDTTGAILASP